ncbi:MAG: hypothetical protein ACYTDY_11325, partial [Planctomycetota bacterium]
MGGEPALSVVIPTIPSRAHYLERCLAALSACRNRERLEVLVVTEEAARVRAQVAEWSPEAEVRAV